MKKFSKKIWNLYKNSEEGKELISLFKKAASPECTGADMLALAKLCNARYFSNYSDRDNEKTIKFYDDVKKFFINNTYEATFKQICATYEDKAKFFQWYLKIDVGTRATDVFEDIPQGKFKGELFFSIIATWAIYGLMPSGFIPNIFAFQFNYLSRFANNYEIELPAIPKRSAYKDRCTYYLELNNILHDYAKLNGIDAPEEVCAFLFGLALPLAKEEIEEERIKMPKIPGQAWLLVGSYKKGEQNMQNGFWQANPLTRRGDVMVFYEKYPVKKVNSIWIAQDDGVADPFFHFYGYTFISNRIDIPDDMALSYDEFKSNSYFDVENHGREGNFVSKNFQDCSGWPISTKDYEEINRMLRENGFDTGVIPQLYEPTAITTENITDEAAVSKYKICALLNQMGWYEGTDFMPEVKFAAGHSETGAKMDKRPDFCLHPYKHNGKPRTKVLIESKFSLKDNDAINAAFDQTETYAGWGHAKIMLICDKNWIRVYERDRNFEFNPDKHLTRYRWSEMSNNDKYQELKRKLDI